MATYNSDGSLADVNAKIALCTDDGADTVTVPAGSFTWGTGGTHVDVNKRITLAGAGSGSTTITIASSAPTGSSGTIRITKRAVVSGMTCTQTVGTTTVFSTSTTNGWRITDIIYNSQNTTGAASYFVYAGNYGFIDNCTINSGGAADEWIVTRGPTDSWETDSSMGTSGAVYVESCTFNNNGYPDFNSSARGVFRFNTMSANTKIDGHGLSSNSPATGVRQVEGYCNLWTSTSTNQTTLELRGGTGRVFYNNTLSTGTLRDYLTDYGYINATSQFGSVYQTPNNYPIGYQVGTGKFTTIAATAIANRQMVKIKTLGSPTPTDFGAIGAPAGWGVGTQFIATGAGSGDGTVTTTPAATEPMYVWGNLRNGSPWARLAQFIPTRTRTTDTAGYTSGSTVIGLAAGSSAIPVGNYIAFAGDNNRYVVTVAPATSTTNPTTITIAAPGLLQNLSASAITVSSSSVVNYQGQQASSTATFNDMDVILSNRDIFADAGFDTNTGVTIGTAAEMALATPTNKYGFWVKDEGTWNQGFSGTIAATDIQARYFCEIVSLGTTGAAGFTAIGAKSGCGVGDCFLASGAASGNGTVKPAQGKLYVGNGSNWILNYTPYTYPHTNAPQNPEMVSASIASNGASISLTFTISCTTGAGGSGGVTISASGGASTATYSSGSGSATYVYSLSRAINSGEVVTVSYVQPGSGIESTAAQLDLESFSNYAVTNNSAVNANQATNLRNPAAIGAGF